MIAKLKGQVELLDEGCLGIDCHGVVYRVMVSSMTLAQCPEGSYQELAIEPIFRQDQQFLVGFSQEEERRAFKLLLTVQGIGPNLALSILSQLPPSTLFQGVQNQDKKLLTSLHGVGSKVADRMLVELKNKVQATSMDHDAVEALVQLGYTRIEAIQEIESLEDKTLPIETIIYQVLQKKR